MAHSRSRMRARGSGSGSARSGSPSGAECFILTRIEIRRLPCAGIVRRPCAGFGAHGLPGAARAGLLDLGLDRAQGDGMGARLCARARSFFLGSRVEALDVALDHDRGPVLLRSRGRVARRRSQSGRRRRRQRRRAPPPRPGRSRACSSPITDQSPTWPGASRGAGPLGDPRMEPSARSRPSALGSCLRRALAGAGQRHRDRERRALQPSVEAFDMSAGSVRVVPSRRVRAHIDVSRVGRCR